MIGLEHVWGAVGFAAGVVFASVCIVFELFWTEYKQEMKRIGGRG